MHARLGEVLYMGALSSDTSRHKYLTESVKRFSRSIELCDDYLRGYYGLKLVFTSLSCLLCILVFHCLVMYDDSSG